MAKKPEDYGHIERESISWDSILAWSQNPLLHKEIKRRKITHILPIMNGGLIPASMLVYALHQAKYDCDLIRLALAVSSDTHCLIIDNIIDSGETMINYVSLYHDAAFAAVVIRSTRFSTLGLTTHPNFISTFYRAPQGLWIDFPWEAPQPQARRTSKVKKSSA